ncbi:MAG: hypothetical protein NTW85_08610 [Methylococcales bacterium]|nr:hypothetical protein [Methylococcales bacterium]
MTIKGEYNFIYTTLVKDERDIIGIIAYGLYKRQKIEFIRNFEVKYGKAPTDDELKNFHDISNSQSQLESYRLRALELAKEFLETSLAAKANELEDYYDKKASDEIKSAKPKFWFGVAQGFVASFLFVLFIGSMVFFLQAANLGIKNAIEAAFNVQINSISK